MSEWKGLAIDYFFSLLVYSMASTRRSLLFILFICVTSSLGQAVPLQCYPAIDPNIFPAIVRLAQPVGTVAYPTDGGLYRNLECFAWIIDLPSGANTITIDFDFIDLECVHLWEGSRVLLLMISARFLYDRIWVGQDVSYDLTNKIVYSTCCAVCIMACE